MTRLRAARPGEEPFLFRVYASTRTEELAPVPWTDEQKAAFLAAQFQAQHVHYHTHYPGADYLVIESEAGPIGRLYVDRTGGEIHVIDIALLPEHRGRGVGTRLLQELVAEADAAGRRMRLWVEPSNPARRLYERLGFRALGEPVGVYVEMERPAAVGVS